MGSETVVSPANPATMVSTWLQRNGRSDSPHWGVSPNSSNSRSSSAAL